eukprot:1663888-Rhodomonas_salina.2
MTRARLRLGRRRTTTTWCVAAASTPFSALCSGNVFDSAAREARREECAQAVCGVRYWVCVGARRDREIPREVKDDEFKPSLFSAASLRPALPGAPASGPGFMDAVTRPWPQPRSHTSARCVAPVCAGNGVDFAAPMSGGARY